MKKSILEYIKGKLARLSIRWRAIVWDYEARDFLTRCASAGSGIDLRMPVVIYHPEGLRLGNNVSIGELTHIRASGGVTIGDRVLIASHVIITSRGHPKELPRYGITLDAAVRIDDDVWIGAGAIILPGAHIHRGAIIAAGAVVTGIVDEMTIFGGVPARKIGQVSEKSHPEVSE